MEMKNIVVCGDSFCCGSTKDRNHFSHLLEDQYGYRVTILAQGGMSNVGICFQLKEAVKLNPDVIVYNMTMPGRVEIVMNNFYKPQNGLRNFVYANPTYASYGNEYVGNERSPIYSTVWQELDKYSPIPVPREKINAIETYLIHLFHWDLKAETDSWMFAYWHQQMLNKEIQPISVSRGEKIAQPLYDFADQNLSWPTCYHTDAATQALVANNIVTVLEKR